MPECTVLLIGGWCGAYDGSHMGVIRLRALEVHFKDGTIGMGRAESIHAAWQCRCDDPSPLFGRCTPLSDPPVTVCPICERRFDVSSGIDMRPLHVREI